MKDNLSHAVVIGGSSGIGLAIVHELIKRGYYVYVISRHQPDNSLPLASGKWKWIQSDLRDYDEQLFGQMCTDCRLNVLMITAGFGRVAEFGNLSQSEIVNLFSVQAVAPIRLIRQFYERIKDSAPFYCGVIGSISGLVSSPLISVYAASKAAICRFVESVNIELEEVAGTDNRILNVSPGSISGTRFNGGQNNLLLLSEIANEIVERMFRFETLYIPKYNEVYADVIARYQKDSYTFGLQSYQYKRTSGRLQDNREIIGYLSGTFDLFHVGHLNLLRRAKMQCDYLIVGIHPSGAWKGKETFIPLDERVKILTSCKYVDKVVIAPDEDNDAWKEYHYHKLFVGSDYQGTERFRRYEEFFSDKGVEIVFFPYTHGTSSTQIRNALLKKG